MNYYDEIEHIIKKYEINKKVREYQENNELVLTYWNIGKLIVEAQGGEKRAKYGDELIKEWSKKLSLNYGKKYQERNLRKIRQFYIIFSKRPTVGAISWSHYREILSIKDENKRNYYINLAISNNLSVRELIEAIKDNSYERLLEKPNKIEIINNNIKEEYKIRENIKNPIIIKLNKDEQILKEKDLELKILAKLQNFFLELGQGYALIDNEYKFKLGNKYYHIDLLLFNYNLNCFIVVELKFRELRKEDKGQIEFYMNYIDQNLKKEFHNTTIGIIVTKHQDKFIVSFISSPQIIPITYHLINL